MSIENMINVVIRAFIVLMILFLLALVCNQFVDCANFLLVYTSGKIEVLSILQCTYFHCNQKNLLNMMTAQNISFIQEQLLGSNLTCEVMGLFTVIFIKRRLNQVIHASQYLILTIVLQIAFMLWLAIRYL